MGAVGGHYLLALARMGVGHFVIADADTFEVVNLHRQAGAFVHTLGRNKAEVMAEMAREINPEVEIRLFTEHVTEKNIEGFLECCDVVLDGIDFFQIDARRLLFQKAREKGIYTITCGPLGYGAALMIFDPRGMDFDGYFGIRAGMTRAERLACFSVGMLPSLFRQGGAVDSSRVDIEREKGPALASAIMLCAGVATTEVLKILLGRGTPKCAPHSFYFDPYRMEYSRSFCRHGRNRLIDRLVRRLAFWKFAGLRRLHNAEREAVAAA
jgi:molybdopterin/thiamine biosynthesis adenylyltransferase